ncbi:MAG: hypothetical protein E7231_18195 [Cellulosilyticum sp.]|jgi:hypothetical protein|nr:hypothetical protein [Cellulosilyticum sp.]
MSYYKLKYASIDKKNKEITLTVADSSVRPLYYFKSPYHAEGQDFRDDLKDFVVSMLNGNIQGGQSKIRQLMSFLRHTMEWSCKETSLDKDFKYKVSRLNGLYELLATEIGVPTLLGEPWSEHQTEVNAKIAAYEAESKALYEAKQKEFDDAGIKPVCSAYSSDVFPGFIVLALKDEDTLAVCEKACYEHLGLLESKKGKCVFVHDDGYKLFHALGYGRLLHEIEIDDAVFTEIAKITNVMKELPYPNFDYKKYGFVLEQEVAA